MNRAGHELDKLPVVTFKRTYLNLLLFRTSDISFAPDYTVVSTAAEAVGDQLKSARHLLRPGEVDLQTTILQLWVETALLLAT